MNTNTDPAAASAVPASDMSRFGLAVLAGLAAAIAGAVLWAVVTVASNYELGIMAIAVGLLVGKSIAAVGRSDNPAYRIAGALCSLAGCVLGNLLSVIGFFATANHVGYFQALQVMNPALAIHLMTVTFSPMDLLFYAIGIYEGYRFAAVQ